MGYPRVSEVCSFVGPSGQDPGCFCILANWNELGDVEL